MPGPGRTAVSGERLRGPGVTFTLQPMRMGQVTTAVFDDTCGNLIAIAAREV